MRAAVLLLTLAACGRFGFEATDAGDDGADDGDADTGDADGSDTDSGDADGTDADDGPPIDGPAISCVSGDNTCLPACEGVDPDCTPVCGDTFCSEIAGEHCGTCDDDCGIRADVCGNGECSATETSSTCETDCGPATWLWAADEQALFDAINTARTEGRSCGGGPAMTAPLLTWDPAVLPYAHEWAWEEAHLEPQSQGFRRCNGRAWSEVYADANVDSANVSSGGLTTQERLDQWLANAGSCMTVMSTANTAGAIGIAVDGDDSFVLLLR